MSWMHRSAVEQRAALDRGEISSLDLLEETIEHSESLAPHINPFALTLYDRAREMALEADKAMARGKGGPLCGIPVTIKDSQWLAGVPCANGSVSLRDFIPGQTSRSVELLEEAGAVIFAKTTCPEFSLSGITESHVYGRTSNPWDVSRTPGGSSGGAAAAVAASMGSLSLGGDGGGSIRIPAGFCGITGFKPGFGNVPREPGFETWESIISYGPISRSVADARLMYEVLTGLPSNQDSVLPEHPEEIRIIVSEDLGFAPVDSDVRHAFRIAVARMESAGFKIIHDHPGLSSSVVTWATTATYDMWKHKGPHLESGHEMGEYARAFLEFGSSFSETDFEDAQEQRTKIHNAYAEMFRRHRAAFLMTPGLGCEAFEHGTTHPLTLGTQEITYPWLDWAGFMYDANLAGLPACSIPMGLGDEGLPMALQVMAPTGHDLEVLDLAERVESLIGWKHLELSSHHFQDLEYDPVTTATALQAIA